MHPGIEMGILQQQKNLLPFRGNLDLLSNLVSYWPLNETTGNAIDVHGGHDSSAMVITARSGDDYEFDGVNDYVTIPHHTDFNLNGFSLQAWLWSNVDQKGSAGLVSKDGSNRLGNFSFAFDNSADDYLRCGFVYGSAGGSNKDVYTAAGVSTGVWVHAVGVFNPADDTLKIYRDGTLAGTTTAVTQTPFQNTEAIRFGNRNSGTFPTTYPFEGKLKHIAIWGGTLTQDQITKLYNNGKGLSY